MVTKESEGRNCIVQEAKRMVLCYHVVATDAASDRIGHCPASEMNEALPARGRLVSCRER